MRIAIVFDVTAWSDRAFEGIRAAGLRRGGARRAVVEFLDVQGCCRSAQEIHDGIAAAGDPRGGGPVDRPHDPRTQQHRGQRGGPGAGGARFEPARMDRHHHHHLVCDDCGKVEPFTDEPLEQALRGAAGRLGYALEQHDVVLRGACQECRSPAASPSGA